MGVSLSASFIERPLDAALAASPAGVWEGLRGARLLITGATGFFGAWTLSALAKLNDELSLGAQALCLSRDPAAFLARRPDLAARAELSWERVGPGGLPAPRDRRLSHILHMAASADARDYEERPAESFMSIVDGARFAARLSRQTGAHLHFVSSGAVYGPRRLSDGPCLEEQITRFAPNPLDAAAPYANAKRAAESLIACSGSNWSISRPFAFLGPLLPLDLHFAAGNFIRDAVAGRPISLTGDGSPIRSYMHPADLAMWTLALCALGRQGLAVNVGSDEPLSLKELAFRVSEIALSPAPAFGAQASPPDPSAYWPSTELASSLGLRRSLGLLDCVSDAALWARGRS